MAKKYLYEGAVMDYDLGVLKMSYTSIRMREHTLDRKLVSASREMLRWLEQVELPLHC